MFTPFLITSVGNLSKVASHWEDSINCFYRWYFIICVSSLSRFLNQASKTQISLFVAVFFGFKTPGQFIYRWSGSDIHNIVLVSFSNSPNLPFSDTCVDGLSAAVLGPSFPWFDELTGVEFGIFTFLLFLELLVSFWFFLGQIQNRLPSLLKSMRTRSSPSYQENAREF